MSLGGLFMNLDQNSSFVDSIPKSLLLTINEKIKTNFLIANIAVVTEAQN